MLSQRNLYRYGLDWFGYVCIYRSATQFSSLVENVVVASQAQLYAIHTAVPIQWLFWFWGRTTFAVVAIASDSASDGCCTNWDTVWNSCIALTACVRCTKCTVCTTHYTTEPSPILFSISLQGTTILILPIASTLVH